MRILAWIPVLIVALVLIWGYYVYVYVMNFSGKLAHMNINYDKCSGLLIQIERKVL